VLETVSKTQENVNIPGPKGTLEGILTYSENSTLKQTILIVGPHPLLGGDFNNNVVRELSQQLVRSDTLTLRFNFRGVGCSEGTPIVSTDNIAKFWARSEIDDEAALQDDVEACARWLRSLVGKVDVVIGYSFGAWLASRWAADQKDVNAMILFAPTIAQHDYSHLKRVTKRKLILASHDDFAVPLSQLKQQFSQWAEPKELHVEEMDNHFFRGCERQISNCVRTFLGDAA